MGLFTRDIKSLEHLFLHTLRDMYYAEHRIVKTLPSLIETATEPRLKKDLAAHLEETQGQLRRLRNVFTMLRQEPKGTRCPGIDGILSEGDSLLGNVDGRKVTDAAIVASAQAVEHYEMCRYGTLIAWARVMGRDELAGPLEQNLREEKAADRKLSALAEARVNTRADKSRSRTASSRPRATVRRATASKRPAAKPKTARRKSA